MAMCPSCNAPVEEGADLCLECGEPMGDSPAAKVARSDHGPPGTPSPGAPKPPPPGAPPSVPSGPKIIGRTTPMPRPVSPTGRPTPTPTPPPRTAPPPAPKTVPAMPAAKKKWAVEEPEPVRCPGCGLKTHAVRCPSCGTRLRHDDD
jgi:hypothetical protein